MKEILPSMPFSSGTEYEIFLDNFCYRCKKHKIREDGFCAFVEQGGCPIENAMEDARFGSPFPSEDIVKIVENGKIVNWNICKSFETDDKGLMKAYKKLFADHPTEKGGETLDNIQKYCNDCDIKGYCDKIPTNCPIAKEYKRIAEFEKAKSELKSELSKPFIKFLDWLENKLQRIEKWWHNG